MADLIFHFADGGKQIVVNARPSGETDMILGAFLSGADVLLSLYGQRVEDLGYRLLDVTRIEAVR